MRTVHHLALPSYELWLQLMVDDLKLEETSATPEVDIVWVLVLWLILGVPLAWKKIHRGSSLAWTGFSVVLRALTLGISEGRAAWAIGWLERFARDGCADIEEVKGGVGRLARGDHRI